jgi:hypothetical protein
VNAPAAFSDAFQSDATHRSAHESASGERGESVSAGAGDRGEGIDIARAGIGEAPETGRDPAFRVRRQDARDGGRI